MLVRPAGLRRLVREPLFHFLLIGAALYIGYARFEHGAVAAGSANEVRLTTNDLLQLETVFAAKWNRGPTEAEFRTLLENRIKEEVLYREALALGLDKDDTIVRRRMAQKMQFLAEDMAAAREPGIEELRAWYRDHGELFALPPRLSFRHLYFAADRRRENTRSDAEAALVGLAGEAQDSARAMTLADPFMFQDYYGDRTPRELTRDFGPDFVQALMQLTPGAWQGPIRSGYGWHLVFVDSRTPGRIPAFAEVEDDVRIAWLGEQKARAREKAYREIRAKYTLVIPGPPQGDRGDSQLAVGASPPAPAAAAESP